MKQFFTLFFTFLSINIFAQKTKQSSKISIGYSFSPDYSFRTLKNGDGNNSTDIVIKSRNDNEKAKFGYTTGINVTFSFSEFFGFETGVQY